MAVMRSRLRAHAVEWHVAPAAHIDSRHRSGFLDLQRRCNQELCRHHALTHNAWLDSLEASSRPLTLGVLLACVEDLAHFLSELFRARERHAGSLKQDSPHDCGDCGTAVVICFDENGVPWCPPLPGMGMGDPVVMQERLQGWLRAWRRAASGDIASSADLLPATTALCALVARDYDAMPLSQSLGAMMALENAISTDFWQRLGRGLREACEGLGLKLPDAGFFPVAETHARLQARHVLYLVEGASVHDLLEEERFFASGIAALERLDAFWAALAERLGGALQH